MTTLRVDRSQKSRGRHSSALNFWPRGNKEQEILPGPPAKSSHSVCEYSIQKARLTRQPRKAEL